MENNEMEDLQYVGFWSRFWASAVDVIILIIIIYPLFYMIYGSAFMERAGDFTLVNNLINYLLPFIAVIILWRSKGATPGKMLIKATIVDAESLGEPSMKQLIVRYFAYIVSAVPLFLGYFWAGWDKKKQTWHDKLAHIVVVQPKKTPKKKSIGSYIAIGFGVFAIVIFTGLMAIGFMLQTEMMPDGDLYDAKKIPSNVTLELLEKGVLHNGEVVNYYQPEGTFSFTNSGTVFTDENIRYFETDENDKVLIWDYPFAKINNYSLARYENNRRVEKYGNYAYPEHLPDAFKIEKEIDFSEYNDYSHLVYRLSNGYVYVLSLKNQPIFGRLAPFSYLFILFGVLYALMYLFSGNNVLFNTKLKLNFGKRLQLIMIAIILSSFTIISMLTVLYINDLNENKNKDQLTRLAVSLQTEFEHKLSSQKDLSKIDPSYLNSLLQKFSKVFDTDINIYLLDGTLLSSTRPEIFNKNLMSELINPQALFDLKYEHQSIFIARENIGLLVFSSAYMPFHNSDGEIIALLNLPYFAKEEILKSEVSTLLMALMNVYTLIIVVAILLILFVSKYISRPLLMLKLHMQGVKMGKDNNKIEWSGIEEIQALVSEYNKMIDALEISSEKLAKSERETAWREMAKQVAHEIKNPLTPMKLSVQYMMHSYDENGKNQKEKLQSLSNTLVEQIDALTDIATAFSDFANMPKSTKEMHNMASIINATADIYKDYNNVQINLNLDSEIIIRIDKNQWLRVYNNLFKNSIQAIISEQQMLIDVSLNRVGDDVVVIFKDNGQGISEEMKDRIFVPSFTTKTTGSGLGLAMVRNIVNNSDGDISFESELGKGTSFIIKLKV